MLNQCSTDASGLSALLLSMDNAFCSMAKERSKSGECAMKNFDF